MRKDVALGVQSLASDSVPLMRYIYFDRRRINLFTLIAGPNWTCEQRLWRHAIIRDEELNGEIINIDNRLE